MMASHRRNPSPTPSISSLMSEVSSEISQEEQEARAYVKSKLVKRFFLGQYQERRYIENLRVYRDMVVLHSSEVELRNDLERVQSKLFAFYGGDKWVGITSPDTIGAPAAGHCLWVKLQDVAFGYYWFQIRQIRYYDHEIHVRLKVVRPVMEEVANPCTSSPMNLKKAISENVDALKSRIRTSIHALTESQSSPSNLSSDPGESVSMGTSPSGSEQGENTMGSTSPGDVKQKEKKEDEEKESTKLDKESSPPDVKKVETLKIEDFVVLMHFLLQNWKDILKFLSVVLVSTISGLGSCIRYVGEYSLRFMHEITHLLHVVTPIILAVIELVGKLVGGLYLLIAMVFNRGHGPVPTKQFIPPTQGRRPLPIQYRSSTSRF